VGGKLQIKRKSIELVYLELKHSERKPKNVAVFENNASQIKFIFAFFTGSKTKGKE
jgi:hypothetical protein